MNIQKPSASKAQPQLTADTQTRLSAMQRLETDIRDLANMAHILHDMLEVDLVEYTNTGEKFASPPDGKDLTVILTERQVSCIAFASWDVLSRAMRLERKFDAAWDGVQI